MVRLLAERSDTKSNVKLGGFRSELQASYVSSHTGIVIQRNGLSVYIYMCVCVSVIFVFKALVNGLDLITWSYFQVILDNFLR